MHIPFLKSAISLGYIECKRQNWHKNLLLHKESHTNSQQINTAVLRPM